MPPSIPVPTAPSIGSHFRKMEKFSLAAGSRVSPGSHEITSAASFRTAAWTRTLTINHEWTPIHTNDRRTLTPVLHCTRRTNRFCPGFCLSFIRVHLCVFVLSKATHYNNGNRKACSSVRRTLALERRG